MNPSMNGPENFDTLAIWASYRRYIETDGKCAAAIWLRNGKTGEWYEWDTCTNGPGHEGPHSVWSDRDSDEWASWTDTTKAVSRQVDIAKDEQRLHASPWKPQELAVLASAQGRA